MVSETLKLSLRKPARKPNDVERAGLEMLHLRRKSGTVTAYVFGGLGNQLFQLAAGHYVASQSGQKLKIQLKSSLAGQFVRNPDIELIHAILPDVQISEEIGSASAAWVRLVNFALRESSIAQKTLRIHSPAEVGLPEELSSEHWNELRGHYQTYIFSEFIAQRLRSLPMEQTSWYQVKSTEIESQRDSVAIHYRRGDYVKLANEYGLLTPEYFKQTAQKYLKNYSDAKFYIFSDDVESAERELAPFFKNYEVINPPMNSKAIESLLLMSKCRNIILSNSTFSLWAGIVSGKSSVKVAPTPWMKNGVKIKELIPTDWVTNEAIWES